MLASTILHNRSDLRSQVRGFLFTLCWCLSPIQLFYSKHIPKGLLAYHIPGQSHSLRIRSTKDLYTYEANQTKSGNTEFDTRRTAEDKMTTNGASSSTDSAHASVLTPSEAIPENALHVKGPDFNNAITLQDLMTSYEKIGFQATGLAKAIKIIEDMVRLLWARISQG
jgi:hypothetical protein